MDTHYTGRSISVEEAIPGSDQIVIARLFNPGNPDPGAPGQAYYGDAEAEVVRWLQGEPPPEKRPLTVTFNYTVQRMPEAEAEQAPVAGDTYLFFLAARGGSVRAIKILPASPEEVSGVERALRRR